MATVRFASEGEIALATLRPELPLSILRVAPSGNVRVIWGAPGEELGAESGAASAMSVSSQSLHTKQVRCEAYLRSRARDVKQHGKDGD
jgi:hypothetical protein